MRTIMSGSLTQDLAVGRKLFIGMFNIPMAAIPMSARMVRFTTAPIISRNGDDR
jgi:hypothetical protein